jgi:hypothetical protein
MSCMAEETHRCHCEIHWRYSSVVRVAAWNGVDGDRVPPLVDGEPTLVADVSSRVETVGIGVSQYLNGMG